MQVNWPTKIIHRTLSLLILSLRIIGTTLVGSGLAINCFAGRIADKINPHADDDTDTYE